MRIICLHLSLLFLLSGCSKLVKPQQLLADVKELSSDKYQGRKTGTNGNKMAADYIVKRFEEVGLKPFNENFRLPFSIKNQSGKLISGTNLAGLIRGKNDDVIVISAHYDHVGIIDGVVYNGADDNASGVAALLNLAKYSKANPPQQTLIFVAFDAEEQGLLGSKAFVEAPPLDLSRIKLDVNLDMVSRADNSKLYVAGSYHYPELKKYIVSSNKQIKLVAGHDSPKNGKEDWTNQSDHFSFHKKGIPFIYFGVESHKDYHKASDDFERINKVRFENCADVILKTLIEIDKGMAIHKSFREKVIMN